MTTLETVLPHIEAKVKFQLEQIPEIITQAMLPTLNREEFSHANYRGAWHPLLGGIYTMFESDLPRMMYLDKIDTWAVHAIYHLWGTCSEKKCVIVHNLFDMERVYQGGLAALAAVRVGG